MPLNWGVFLSVLSAPQMYRTTQAGKLVIFDQRLDVTNYSMVE